MAKYWPSSFMRFYSSRSIKTQKRTGAIYMYKHFDPNKFGQLLYGQKQNSFLRGTKWEIPSGHDGLILPARVANQNAGFASSCPPTDSAI